MSELPGDLQYTSDHEWLRRGEDGNVTIGITDHAQQALGDDPEVINSDPYGEGWIVRVQPGGDEGDLLSPDAYQSLLDALD